MEKKPTSILVLLIFVFSFSNLNAQNTDYSKKMTNALKLWESMQPNKALEILEPLAETQTKNWIPSYYVGLIHRVMSFMEKDKIVVNKRLLIAEKAIKKSKSLDPNNAEILIVEALINSSRISFDKEKYGVLLSGKNIKLFEKMIAIAPNNPRVLISKAEWDLGMASYLGENYTNFCNDIKSTIPLFKKFKSDIPFYPDWGLDRANQLLNKCNKK